MRLLGFEFLSSALSAIFNNKVSPVRVKKTHDPKFQTRVAYITLFCATTVSSYEYIISYHSTGYTNSTKLNKSFIDLMQNLKCVSVLSIWFENRTFRFWNFRVSFDSIFIIKLFWNRIFGFRTGLMRIGITYRIMLSFQ